MANTPIDRDLVHSLAQLLDEARLTEIEYEADGVRVRLARGVQTVTVAAPAPAAAAPAPAAVDPDKPLPGAVLSPMVGVVYLSPEPTEPPFVSVGDQVSAGQTLLLIEAMKTFNPIRAQKPGKVTRILVEDGHPVEFGEPMIVIE